MKISSNCLSCAPVCFSLCAQTWPASGTRRRTRSIADATMRASPFMLESPVGAIEEPFLIGDPWAEDLIGVVAAARVRCRLAEDVLAPHAVVDLHAVGRDRETCPSDAIERIAGIGPQHALGLDRDLRRVGPGPRGGQHADESPGSYFAVARVVSMPVDVGDVRVGLEDLVKLAPVSDPELPGRVVLVEWIVAEDHEGPILRPGGHAGLKPAELLAAHAGPGGRRTPVEGGHPQHALLGAELLGGPEVGRVAHGVQADEANALVVEAPWRLPEELFPCGAHVQVPVVLAGDVDLAGLDSAQDLGAQTQLDRIAELRQIAAKDDEVGRGRHRLDLLHGE